MKFLYIIYFALVAFCMSACTLSITLRDRTGRSASLHGSVFPGPVTVQK